MSGRARLCLLTAGLLLICQCALAGALTEEDLVWTLNGQRFRLGDGAETLVGAMREEFGEITVTEAQSCMFAGLDREYDAGGAVAGTYPSGKNGAEALETVIVMDAGYPTERGARVGMTRDEIVALYGNDYILDYDTMIYELYPGGPQLSFIFEGDSVSAWMLFRNTSV
ncbi:MAG: hypothetical protein IJ240_03080 [Clostridia bacterium]|nr:hypothetical protein [Clostridia bacterium]